MSRSTGFIVALVLALFAAGCQPYAPRPLDLRGHAGAWATRSPQSAEVAAYARQLAESAGETPVFNPADGLTLREAEVVALFFNPSLRAARLKARVPAAGAAEAGRWADPELAIDAERIVRSVEEPWVLGGLLNLTLPLSGRLAREKDHARAEADVERLRALAAEQALLSELREQWHAYSAAVLRYQLIEASLDDVEVATTRAKRLREAGELDWTDAGLFEIERAMLRSRRIVARGEMGQLEFAIKSKMGLVPNARVMLVPGLDAPDADRLLSTSSEEMTELAAEMPQVRVARAEYEAAERLLALETRKQYPDVTVGGGFGTDEGEERLLGGISVPIPLLNANRRAIAEARAGREAARAAAEAAYEEAVAELADAGARLSSARERLHHLETEVVPLVNDQLKQVQAIMRLGDADGLLLLETFQTAHATKLEVLDARLELAKAASRLRGLLSAGSTEVEVGTAPAPTRPATRPAGEEEP